jgi:hypothetical protein
LSSVILEPEKNISFPQRFYLCDRLKESQKTYIQTREPIIEEEYQYSSTFLVFEKKAYLYGDPEINVKTVSIQFDPNREGRLILFDNYSNMKFIDDSTVRIDYGNSFALLWDPKLKIYISQYHYWCPVYFVEEKSLYCQKDLLLENEENEENFSKESEHNDIPELETVNTN